MAEESCPSALCNLPSAVCGLQLSAVCRLSLPSSVSLPPHFCEVDDCPVTQVELDEWHFFLIRTVLLIPFAFPTLVVWLSRQDPRRTGLATGSEPGVKQVGW